MNQTETKIDFKEFIKLYGYNIPFLKEAEYYISNLEKSKEFSDVRKKLSDFKNFQNSLPEDISPKKFKMQLLDKIVGRLKELEVPTRLNAIDLNGHKFQNQSPTFEQGPMYLSVDLSEANWNIYKTFGNLKYDGTWGQWLKKEFNAPDALIASKSFRQIVFGHMNPGRTTKLQEVLTLKLIQKINELKDYHEGIIGISADEVILKGPGFFGFDTHNPLYKIDIGVPIKYKQFSVEFHELYDKKIRVNNYIDIHTREVIPSLKEVPGNQFWLYFKTLILKEELEERDLLFENDHRLAKWVL